MSDYEKVLEHLKSRCKEIMAKWNGDESGPQDVAADTAKVLLELLEDVDGLVKELDL